jgi:iron complex outermembrane receptor protein
VGLQDSSGRLPTATSVLNAGRSRMFGFEADSSVRLGPMFRIDAAAAYLETKIVSMSLPAFPGYDVQVLPAVGGPLTLAPKWSANLSGTFIAPTPEDLGKIELSATYRHASSYLTGGPGVHATPVKQLDLNLDWRNVAGKPVDVALFATNVTKQFTYSWVTTLFPSFGFNSGYIGQPRMYGVRVRARFGEGVWN